MLQLALGATDREVGPRKGGAGPLHDDHGLVHVDPAMGGLREAGDFRLGLGAVVARDVLAHLPPLRPQVPASTARVAHPRALDDHARVRGLELRALERVTAGREAIAVIIHCPRNRSGNYRCARLCLCLSVSVCMCIYASLSIYLSACVAVCMAVSVTVAVRRECDCVYVCVCVCVCV